MLEEYYCYRGCSTDGLPTKKRLLEIGLDDVAEDLTRKGKIGVRECPKLKNCWQNLQRKGAQHIMWNSPIRNREHRKDSAAILEEF